MPSLSLQQDPPMEYRYTVDTIGKDEWGQPMVVLTGSEEAIRALGAHWHTEVRILLDLEPSGDSRALPTPTPPATPLTDDQVQAGTDLLVVWHSVLPAVVPQMREGGGLWFRPDPLVEISLDYYNYPDMWRWGLSVVVDGKPRGPAVAVVYEAGDLPVKVRRVLERYVRDYSAGTKKGPERSEPRRNDHGVMEWAKVQDYRDHDLPAVPWCRWVLERMKP